ncbi:MAG: hypothetical protein PHQ21_09485, partial [Firmicutes bacterium]|nr:hypothetical protein [Bacillota bacterium]
MKRPEPRATPHHQNARISSILTPPADSLVVMFTPQSNCRRPSAEVLGGARQGKELAGLALGDHLQPRLQDKPARADVSAQPLSQLSLK